MILFKIIKHVSIKHLTEDNEERGSESWPADPQGIEKAFELFLKKPFCMLIFWGPFWRREIAIRRNERKIKLMLPKKKGG